MDDDLYEDAPEEVSGGGLRGPRADALEQLNQLLSLVPLAKNLDVLEEVATNLDINISNLDDDDPDQASDFEVPQL